MKKKLVYKSHESMLFVTFKNCIEDYLNKMPSYSEQRNSEDIVFTPCVYSKTNIIKYL